MYAAVVPPLPHGCSCFCSCACCLVCSEYLFVRQKRGHTRHQLFVGWQLNFRQLLLGREGIEKEEVAMTATLGHAEQGEATQIFIKPGGGRGRLHISTKFAFIGEKGRATGPKSEFSHWNSLAAPCIGEPLAKPAHTPCFIYLAVISPPLLCGLSRGRAF